jgi:hypothetical protein
VELLLSPMTADVLANEHIQLVRHDLVPVDEPAGWSLSDAS